MKNSFRNDAAVYDEFNWCFLLCYDLNVRSNRRFLLVIQRKNIPKLVEPASINKDSFNHEGNELLTVHSLNCKSIHIPFLLISTMANYTQRKANMDPAIFKYF